MAVKAAKTLVAATRGGARRDVLEVLRNRLAADLDRAEEPRDVAALALRLTDVLQQLDDMPTSTQDCAADEIAERRAARRSVSK